MRLPRWLTHNVMEPDQPIPPEVPWLRVIGLGVLAFMLAAAIGSPPHAGVLRLRSLGILVVTVVFLACCARALPLIRSRAPWRAGWIGVMAVAGVAGIALQPGGAWVIAPYIVGAACAVRLPPRLSLMVFLADLAATVTVTLLVGHGDQAASVATGTIPFYLFMRMMRRQREAHDETKTVLEELRESRAAEAVAAAEAERARVAREMHDVLAHSLSALSLQLESTRLLAAEHGADPAVTAGIERAHTMAATGLDEARRAIGTMRGEALPGPARIPSLVEAFASASGVPCSFDVTGAERELAPEARLAVYRTAQEALTNVRRHATPAAVAVSLAYGGDGTRLAVVDRGGVAGATVNGSGYGLTGMRERAELLGGELAAAPTTDGFRVELWIPA